MEFIETILIKDLTFFAYLRDGSYRKDAVLFILIKKSLSPYEFLVLRHAAHEHVTNTNVCISGILKLRAQSINTLYDLQASNRLFGSYSQ